MQVAANENGGLCSLCEVVRSAGHDDVKCEPTGADVVDGETLGAGAQTVHGSDGEYAPVLGALAAVASRATARTDAEDHEGEDSMGMQRDCGGSGWACEVEIVRAFTQAELRRERDEDQQLVRDASDDDEALHMAVIIIPPTRQSGRRW